MNEVDKLYSNAGIKSKAECTSKVCIVTNPHKDWCNKCESLKYKYPQFTAEKQLELIKWLCIRDEFNFYQNKITKDWVFYDHEKDATYYDFELGLASWINYLWQDLTDAEKAQIKEILE